jgi:hypothetical protein
VLVGQKRDSDNWKSCDARAGRRNPLNQENMRARVRAMGKWETGFGQSGRGWRMAWVREGLWIE